MNIDELKNLFLKIKNDKKTLLIILLALTGMLLVLLSGNEQGSIKEKADASEITVRSERELADDVSEFIENIKGAGKSKVILTFETYEESIYAYDEDKRTEADGSTDYANKYVIMDSGNEEGGLKLKIISPRIRGVAVLCKGGDNPVIKEQIVSAIAALFDISTNKISVSAMAD